MTRKTVCLRIGYPVVAAIVALFTSLSACSPSPDRPSDVVAAATPAPQRLSIVVTVSNTHLGNAVPSDLKVTVGYDGTAPSTTTLDGSASSVELSVPRRVNYQVSVAPLDGYTTVLSPGCAGTAVTETATCEVTASDVAVGCDKALWDPVYTKDRLKILGACEVATGIVMGTEIERDGDAELWITPDPQYSKLMRPGNQHSRGWLVVEIPCQAPIVQQDAMGTCDKFIGPKVPLPAAGAHIIVAAPWVEDRTHYSWGELHGARIVKLPR
jgi:hypothetical protein